MEPDALAELLAAPAHAAPDGVTPNFENPPNKNGLAWFVTTICAVVVTSSVCLRLVARVWMYRRIRIEEGSIPVLIFNKSSCARTANSFVICSYDDICLRESSPLPQTLNTT